MHSERSHLLYRTLWRWHFYAALFCIPFVITLALSGMIYLFKPQIDALVDKPFHNLEIGSARSTPNEQIDAALAAVPDTAFLTYTLPQSERHAVVVNLSDAAGERVLVYVNPYTLEILKIIGYDDQFIRKVRSFHGELLAGNAGSVLVELAGNWAIVLILTGLYLWWPRDLQGWGGLLYPRLTLKGRLFWRDLHAVLGFWVAIFALFLLVTGLPWTLVWNSAFTEVREWVQENPEQQEWTVSRAEEHHMNQRHSVAEVNLPPAVVATAQAQQLAAPAELGLDPARPGHWLLASDHQNRLLRTRVWISGQEARVVEIKPYSERSKLDLAIGVGTAVHEGQLFGWFNQLLGVVTATALLTLSVSGFIMWRRRKPEGVLGAPRKLEDSGLVKGVAGITLLCALLLPLLALSLLALFLLESLLLRHMTAARTWLGLT